jgi:hypothetical protein
MATSTPAPRTSAPKQTQTEPYRNHARVAGVFYLVTFVSIPTLALYEPVREAGYIVGAGPDTAVLVGGVLEFIVALACIGTAIALYPVVKRQNEGFAMGFVGTRVLEAALIIVGIACLWTVVTLRQAGVGADAQLTGQVLVGMYDRIFLLSQSTIPVFNALLLGSLLYRSRLVARWLPVLGLIGAPLLLASNAAIVFGLWDRVSPASAVAVVPIAVWEFSLGVYLVVKGFRPSAAAQLQASPSS